MYYWIIYDISADRVRNKVAKACKRAGLRRVQKSVFLGEIGKKSLKSLRSECNRWVNWRTDKVFFVPTAKQDFQKIGRTGAKRQSPLLPGVTTPAFY